MSLDTLAPGRPVWSLGSMLQSTPAAQAPVFIAGGRPVWSLGTTLRSTPVPTVTAGGSGMPPMVGAAAITGGVNLFTSYMGNRAQSNAARYAADAQSRAAEQQLMFLREQASREEQMAREQWDAEQARRAPYRAASAQILGYTMGMPVEPYAPPSRSGGNAGGTGATGDTSQYQSYFNSLTAGRAPTPQELVALEPQLRERGIQVMRNAAGVAGKIRLPGGEIVDVIEAAGLGGRNWQWLTGPGGGASGGSAPRLNIDYSTPRQTGGATLAAGGGNFTPAVGAPRPGMTVEDMLARRF